MILVRIKKFLSRNFLLNQIRYLFSKINLNKKYNNNLFDCSRICCICIGFDRQYFHGFINIDHYRASGKTLVADLLKLPLRNQSVKLCRITQTRLMEKPSGILCEIKRVLVPGGRLVVDRITNLAEITALIPATEFSQVSNTRPEWILNTRDSGYELAVQSTAECYNVQITSQIRSTQEVSLTEEVKPTTQKKVNISGFQNLSYQDVRKLLRHLSELSKKNHFTLQITVQAESVQVNHYYDKGGLAQTLDESGWRLLKLHSPNVNVLVAQADQFNISAVPILDKDHKKVLAIGEYSSLRYSQLGFHWDGQARALDELGYNAQFIDIRRVTNYESIVSQIQEMKPNYILFGIKECLDLVEQYADFFKKVGSKKIYWFCDPEHPHKRDLNQLVDYMFLSNVGQISQYQKAYGLERVFYLPQAFSPNVMNPTKREELFDIAFAGALSHVALHDSRRHLIDKLTKRYDVRISNAVRNTISEFYAKGRFAFGVSDFDYSHYTSNRFFIALGCGACYVFKYFEGAEELVDNHRHAIWFKTEEELFEVIDRYLHRPVDRKQIRENASKIAQEKHTYARRMKNLFDIVEERTQQFNGFLSPSHPSIVS